MREITRGILGAVVLFTLSAPGLFLSTAAMAQAELTMGDSAEVETDETETDASDPTQTESTNHTVSEETLKKTTFNINNYLNPTPDNLAHLYWTLGMLDINNNAHIDNFLLLTECPMFHKYITNDLEWAEIRASTREFLQKNYKYFPRYFKISIPLYLGRYDEERETFEVNMDKSVVNAARKIETIYYTKMLVCGKAGEIEGYPKNLILLLNRPFSLPFVPVEKELARLFLDEVNLRNERRSMKAGARSDAYERLVVLELMIRIHSFKERVPTVGGTLKAAVFSQIDYIRVFADMEKEKLLYEKDMFNTEQRLMKRRSDPGNQNRAPVLPSGPIFGHVIEEEEEEEQ